MVRLFSGETSHPFAFHRSAAAPAASLVRQSLTQSSGRLRRGSTLAPCAPLNYIFFFFTFFSKFLVNIAGIHTFLPIITVEIVKQQNQKKEDYEQRKCNN